ncbi:exosortase-associated protein EpsI, B-type [Chitinolyticbacter meiyuanensis]|uniref:exosortase-associated protein EpsI, B-type n=1 Tax=Chitinolyticbacter meiyuanensis TaxID=682798 RepID=UPI0011E5F9E2|nr:exosortase-associated protein EpsI, B-type [Chitinolyticbacter meiyuanensis]
MSRFIIVALLMVAAAAGGLLLQPSARMPVLADGHLAEMVPKQFAGWRVDERVAVIAPTADVQANLDQIYDQVVSRGYVNAQGKRMMLTIAYGGDQSDAFKAHRQEVCYSSQGFVVSGLHGVPLAVSQQGATLPAIRFVAAQSNRVEPVTYWFIMGEKAVRSQTERLETQIGYGLRGYVTDGVLVRVSSIDPDINAGFADQQQFVTELLRTLPPNVAARLTGQSSFVGAPA